MPWHDHTEGVVPPHGVAGYLSPLNISPFEFVRRFLVRYDTPDPIAAITTGFKVNQLITPSLAIN
jgi:hypothetical protein